MLDTEKYVKIVSSQTEKPKMAVIEINNQDITITENGVYTADAGYTGIGTATVNVPQPEPVIESINITPTTSEQTITASGGIDGYSPITVSAVTSSIDTNITAGNIKEGVSILGVEGELKPAPVYYIEKTKDANGVLQNGTTFIDLTGVTAIGNYVLSNILRGSGASLAVPDFSSIISIGYAGMNAMIQNTSVFGNINLSSLTTVDAYGLYYAFASSNISSVNLSALTTISQNYSLNHMCDSCTMLTSIDLSLLTNVSGLYGCGNMFYGCTGLISVDLSSLTTVNGSNGCSQMFVGCTGLTSVDLSGLTTISSQSGCEEMFWNCTGLTSVSLSALTTVNGSQACRNMFRGCTSLITLSFPALTSTSFGNYTNQFNRMLNGVTGCTVHFPSNLQSVIGSWSDVTAGFGGTNTTVLFDLPATE